MSIYTINKSSTHDEIQDFYYLYVESFSKLCIHNRTQIIDLSEYLSYTTDIEQFIGDVEYITRASGLVIHYTHNDDMITSISFIETDNITNCYAIVKFLCGNSETREIKIDGKSQGHYMLDYIFQTYRDYVILIEPATPELIPYYTKYKKPSFPYNKNNIMETYNFLVYGNLSRLNEVCFEKIFKSIKIIKNLEKKLQFNSIDDLYERTNDLESLKEKLHIKLKFLIRTKQFPMDVYKGINNLIDDINYYDISEIIMTSRFFESESTTTQAASRGGKKNTKRKKNIYKKKRKRSTKKN